MDLWRSERFVGLEPDQIRDERTKAWEEALQQFAQAAKVKLLELPAKKSAPEKVILAAAMKQRTSASNGWLAGRLGMGQPASVSQFVARYLASEEGAAQVRRVLSKVKA